MMQDIKEKLRKILNSKVTTTFLHNMTKPLGDKTVKCNIISRQDSVNCFLYNVFMNDAVDDEDIDIEDLESCNKINNLIINGKRINVKTLSNKNNIIFFNSFPFREKNFNINFHLKNTLHKLKYFDYFLFIVIFRNERNENFKVKYDFHLVPAEIFYFDIKESNKTLCGFRGKNWIIRSNKEFFFLICKDELGSPIFTYTC